MSLEQKCRKIVKKKNGIKKGRNTFFHRNIIYENGILFFYSPLLGEDIESAVLTICSNVTLRDRVGASLPGHLVQHALFPSCFLSWCIVKEVGMLTLTSETGTKKKND